MPADTDARTLAHLALAWLGGTEEDRREVGPVLADALEERPEAATWTPWARLGGTGLVIGGKVLATCFRGVVFPRRWYVQLWGGGRRCSPAGWFGKRNVRAAAEAALRLALRGEC